MSVSPQSLVGTEDRVYATRVAERRKFPRIQAHCPVRYVGLIGDAWDAAELRDYSATGVCMISDNTVLQNTKIKLELAPESKSRVPRIAAEATVVRCGLRDDHRYEIACKLTKVRPSKAS